MKKLVCGVLCLVAGFGAQAELKWTVTSYDPATWVPAADNALAGIAPTFTSGKYYSESKRTTASTNPGVLVDGVIPGCSESALWGIGNDQVLTWEFPQQTKLASLSVFSRWADSGRGGISVARVMVKHRGDGEFVNVGAPAVSQTGSATQAAVLADTEGGMLADNIVALQIVFGTQQANGTGCAEIEAVRFHYPQSGVIVDGDPDEYAEDGVPTYGFLPQTAGDTVELTATEYVNVTEDKRARCTGWKRYDDETGELVAESTDETRLSCAFTFGKSVRHVWQ